MLTHIRRIVLFALLMALLSVPSLAGDDKPADNPSPADHTDPQQQVEAAIRAGMRKHDIPAVSVAVFDEYKIVWMDGYGSKRAGGPEDVEPKTLFQAASISKPIAAMATLKLVEEGKLDLDAPVNDQLKSWKIPTGNVSQRTRINLRHLLSHSAGLSVHGFPGYATSEERPTVIQILEGKPPANNTAVQPFMRAGYKFSYSGGGITVEQLLLTETAGKPFSELMREIVLDPLEMTSSTYEQPLPESRAQQAAVGHHPKYQPIEGNWHVYPEMAAAGLWTTPHDLALAAIDLAKTHAGKGGQLLSQQMAQQMLTPQNEHCGLGYFVKGEGDSLRFEHGGSNEGYRCMLMAFPATGQGVAIMTNSDTGSAVLSETRNLLAKLYGWPELVK